MSSYAPSLTGRHRATLLPCPLSQPCRYNLFPTRNMPTTAVICPGRCRQSPQALPVRPHLKKSRSWITSRPRPSETSSSRTRPIGRLSQRDRSSAPLPGLPGCRSAPDTSDNKFAHWLHWSFFVFRRRRQLCSGPPAWPHCHQYGPFLMPCPEPRRMSLDGHIPHSNRGERMALSWPSARRSNPIPVAPGLDDLDADPLPPPPGSILWGLPPWHVMLHQSLAACPMGLLNLAAW